MSHNFTVNPDEPQPGEEVRLVGPDGLEDGRVTHIREVTSTAGEFFEVRDDRGSIIVVVWGDEHWVQVVEA